MRGGIVGKGLGISVGAPAWWFLSCMNPSARRVGIFSATALVIGNMLGAGIFTTSGFTLAAIPSRVGVLIAWLIGGLIAMMGALSYGALARRLPESGGEYLFLSRTVHPAAGYVGGWLSLFCGFSAPIAFSGLALGEYIHAWLPQVPVKGVATIAIFGFAWVQAERVHVSGILQNLLVITKLAMIVTLIGLAAAYLPTLPEEPRGEIDGMSFVASLVWIYLAYSGWNAAVYIGGEIRSPERTLPRSLLYGTGLVMLLYLLLNAVFLYAAPMSALVGQAEIAKIAAEAMGGERLAGLVTVVIVMALLTSVSAMTVAGPRVYAKMALDGYLPAWFARHEPPFRASVYLQLAVALFMTWVAGLLQLMTYLGFALGIGSMLVVVGLIRLKRQDSSLAVPGWPWIPYGFVVSMGVITVVSIVERPVESIWGLLTLSIGGVAWWLQVRRK